MGGAAGTRAQPPGRADALGMSAIRENSNCGRLEPGEVAIRPACGRAMLSLHNVFQRAMERAVEQAVRIEIVHGNLA